MLKIRLGLGVNLVNKSFIPALCMRERASLYRRKLASARPRPRSGHEAAMAKRMRDMTFATGELREEEKLKSQQREFGSGVFDECLLWLDLFNAQCRIYS